MRNVKVSVEKPIGLDPQTLALVRVAAATATGDETKLRDRMIAARAVHVPPQWVDELLLQRSEEHTSELQSLAYLVCRLLLEKKKETRQCPGQEVLFRTNRDASP